MAICFRDQENDQFLDSPQKQCANACAMRGHYSCYGLSGAWSYLLIQRSKPTLFVCLRVANQDRLITCKYNAYEDFTNALPGSFDNGMLKR